jgi:hypothetical protein
MKNKQRSMLATPPLRSGGGDKELRDQRTSFFHIFVGGHVELAGADYIMFLSN